MQSLHDVRNVRLHEVGNTPNGMNQWVVLSFDMETTIDICFYAVANSKAEKKLLAIAKLLEVAEAAELEKPSATADPVGAALPIE